MFWSCCPFCNPWLSFLARKCQQQFHQWFVAHCVAHFDWKRSISETIQAPKRNFSKKWTNKNSMKDKYELSAGKPGSDLLPHCCTFEKIRQYILFLLPLQTHHQQIFHQNAFWSGPVKEGRSKKKKTVSKIYKVRKWRLFFCVFVHSRYWPVQKKLLKDIWVWTAIFFPKYPGENWSKRWFPVRIIRQGLIFIQPEKK